MRVIQPIISRIIRPIVYGVVKGIAAGMQGGPVFGGTKELFWAADSRGSIGEYELQLEGTDPQTTIHAVTMYALDHEGVAREFAVDEPVWKGGRVALNGLIMIMRTSTLAETITLPLTGTNNLNINWGDGTQEAVTTPSPTHEYAVAGDYTIECWGTCSRIYFNNTGDKDRLLEVVNFGDVDWTDVNSGFSGCGSLLAFDGGTSDLSQIVNFSAMMRNWSSMTSPPDVSDWDVSSGTHFSDMMGSWTSMTTPPNVTNWDVSSGTDFSYMMGNWASMGAVDIGIDSWVITSATDMTDFLLGSELTTACYDRTLVAWDALTLQPTLTEIHFGNSKYTAGGAVEAARTSLIGKGINIIDAGAV